jgi:AcrR family transcriptional regulator
VGLRLERKLATRRALLDAAFELMAQGRGFGSLSLREVARVAQVVPTAFYRHFRDMDELGLALVDETFATLRRLLREVRQAAQGAEHVASESLRTYLNLLGTHRQVFEFVARERYGGSPAIRAGLARELRSVTMELADDLEAAPGMSHLGLEHRQVVALLITSAVMSLTGDLLDIPSGPVAAAAEATLVRRAEAQLAVIALGASSWQPSPGG